MQIDFYVLEETGEQQALIFTCKLIETLYSQQEQIYVHMGSQREAERMDQLLWTYCEESFLPHQLYQTEAKKAKDKPDIQIGWQAFPASLEGTLINWSAAMPDASSCFQRIIEIVYADLEKQQAARQHYKHYRDRGLSIQTHKSSTMSV